MQTRFLPLSVPFWAVLLLEVGFFLHLSSYARDYAWRYLLFLALSLLMLLSYASWRIARDSYRHLNAWQILVLPLVYSFGLLAFVSLLDRSWLMQLMILSEAIFLHLYLSAIYLKSNASRLYKEDSFENISAVGALLAVYFLASAMMGLQSFLSVPIWSLMIAFSVMLLLLSYQLLWANSMDYRRNWLFVPLLTWPMAYFAWVVSLLPVRYSVAGLVVAAMFYALSGLTRFYVLGRLTSRFVQAYAASALLCLAAVLAGAAWL